MSKEENRKWKFPVTLDQQHSLLYQYSQFRRAIQKTAATVIREADMGPKQLSILYHLGHSPMMNMRDLSLAIGSDPAATTRAVNGLARCGLVRRQKDPKDSRRVVIVLTAKGQTRLPAIQNMTEKIERKLLETLSDNDRENLVRLMNRVIQGLAN